MNIYFELDDSVKTYMGKVSSGKYFAMYGVTGNEPHAHHTRLYHKLMQHSNRAWSEDDNGSVGFAKNRLQDPWDSAVVDMKEFFWIKLKCQTV